MENLTHLINAMADALRGRDALIQVQVGTEYFIRKVGDLNRLAGRPHVNVVTADSSFLAWMGREIGRLQLRKGTIDNHRNALRHLTLFRPELRFSDIDYALIVSFDRFLRALGLAVNTIAKTMKIFRRYVNLAMNEDIFSTNAFHKYHIRTERRERPTLTEREIRKVESVPTMNDEEERVKATFLLATYTGLRYSDASATRKSQLCTANSRKWLVLRQNKTDSEVRIPVGSLFGGKALPLIGLRPPTNARCNIIIKRLCKRAHIRKHVTMHTARRTCASILTARGVYLNVVQRILGHQSVQTTERYISTLDTTVNRAVSRAFR